MARCARKNLLTSFTLLFLLVACSIPPTYSRKNIVDTIKGICKDEFNIDVNVWDTGDTIWVYTTSNILDETGKWNIIDDERWNEEVSEQNRKIYSTLQRVLLSIDNPPRFFCFIMSNIENFGVDWYRIVFIPDIIKYSVEQQAIGYVSAEEINRRIISFYRHTPQALGDKTGEHIKKHDISMGEFIALLVKQGLELEFYNKKRSDNFDIKSLDVTYSNGNLDISFEILLKKYEENLPEPMIKAEEIARRLIGIYSEFHNIQTVVIQDIIQNKTKKISFPLRNDTPLEVGNDNINPLINMRRSDFYVQKGDVEYYDKKYDSAIKNYEKALAVSSNDINALYSMGNAYFSLGDYEKSIDCYSKVFAADPNYSRNQYNLGLAYLELGQFNKAIEYFQGALKNDVENEWIYLGIGSAYLNLKNYNLAVKYFLRALELNPKSTQGYYNLGLAHFYLENYGQAISNYEKTTEIDPDYYLAYHQLGWTYYILGKYKEAIDFYKKALTYEQEDSQYANGYNNLSMIYNAQGNYTEAIDSARKALKFYPDNFTSFYSLGFAYYGNKDYLQALDNFKNAVKVKPDDAQIYVDIGVTYNNLGNKKQAEENFRKAEELFRKQKKYKAANKIAEYLKEDSDQLPTF